MGWSGVGRIVSLGGNSGPDAVVVVVVVVEVQKNAQSQEMRDGT